MDSESADWVHLAQDRDQWQAWTQWCRLCEIWEIGLVEKLLIAQGGHYSMNYLFYSAVRIYEYK
jgi:hypothetical protein